MEATAGAELAGQEGVVAAPVKDWVKGPEGRIPIGRSPRLSSNSALKRTRQRAGLLKLWLRARRLTKC